jgi:hypothetical protein
MDTITAPFMRNLSKRSALSARRFSPEAYDNSTLTSHSRNGRLCSDRRLATLGDLIGVAG